MKVILTQTVHKLGKQGQIVNVADGFARNFLFPRSMALIADKAEIERQKRLEEKAAAEVEKGRAGAEKTAEKLQGATVRVTATTAKGSSKLFGAVTDADIVSAIKDSLKVDIEKRQVALLHPIKRLGVYDVLIDLHREVDATIKLEVADEEGNLGFEVVKEELPPEEVAAIEAAAEEARHPQPVAETVSEELEKPEEADQSEPA